MNLLLRGAAALLAGLALAPAARADVAVRAPFVRVRVGPGVYVRAPFVRVAVPSRTAVSPLELPSLPLGPGAPPPVPAEVTEAPVPAVGPVVVRPMTLSEFARSFKPGRDGGAYEVVLEHPCTCRPVKVCFTLPRGCPRRIVARKGELVIRYGLCRVVRVQFNRDGSYRVRA